MAGNLVRIQKEHESFTLCTGFQNSNAVAATSRLVVTCHQLRSDQRDGEVGEEEEEEEVLHDYRVFLLHGPDTTRLGTLRLPTSSISRGGRRQTRRRQNRRLPRGALRRACARLLCAYLTRLDPSGDLGTMEAEATAALRLHSVAGRRVPQEEEGEGVVPGEGGKTPTDVMAVAAAAAC